MKIIFIGGGNMATALIGGMVGKLCQAQDIWVVDPFPEALERLQQKWPIHTRTESTHIPADADIVVLATKPQQLREACLQIAPLVQSALIISIAAGIRATDLARWLNNGQRDHPRIIRTMPNTPALIGAGITGMTALPDVSAEDRSRADQLLQAVGSTVWVDGDAQIDAITAISGSGPAYVFYFIEALQTAAEQLGLNAEQARQLALGTTWGAAQLAFQSNEPASVLRERVTSKGGTTAAALTSLQQDQWAAALQRATQAAQQRAQELGDALGNI